MYHIFLDRFCKGEGEVTLNRDAVINPDWANGIPQYAQNNGDELSNNVFFGGNLWGVIEKLDYLASLGVTVLYLSPIFKAYSNHRYDTGDYEKIDDFLGGEEAFDTLIREAHARGMKIVLDGVFNHTGDDSRYFNRRGTYNTVGAYQSQSSQYAKWYHFRAFPEDYECWWGIKILPRLNHQNEECRHYFTGEDGIIAKWTDRGVDGWRLDVADELPDSFLDKIRQCVKSEDEDALIIGEVWEDATNKISYDTRRRYLRGKQLDSVMNYPFANALIGFLRGDDAKVLCETVMSVCENYPKKTVDLLMNHIGTHDTVRVLTALGGERANGRSRDWQSTQKMTPEQLENAKKLLYLAAVIQYTLPGIPSLYYGDEAGVEGHGDPFCRKFYPWGNEDMYLVEFYKKLGQFRRNSACFKSGAFKPVFCDGSIFAFKRESESEKVLVCVNREQVPAFIDIESGWENAEIVFGYLPENNKIRIDGLGFTVLKLHQ
jgi:glycosidase